MPARIVTTHYRYKRPPRKRQAAALEVPAVVKAASKPGSRPMPTPKPANDEGKPAPPPAASAIVTIRRHKHAMLAHLLEDMTPEEHQRRGDAADAMFQEFKRRIAGAKTREKV